MKAKNILFVVVIATLPNILFSQKSEPKNEFAVLFGLNQPLFLDGFNFELNYFTPKMAFDFSHGVSLDFAGSAVVGEMKDQHLVAHLPFSTGVGVGYRFTNFLNLRVEPKWHEFEIYYEDETQIEANQIVSYSTFTLGLGLYGKWHPFKKKENALKNIVIAPSIRWWPNVASTLEDNQFEYFNKITNQTEVHEALNIGVANTPWFANVSVGYRF